MNQPAQCGWCKPSPIRRRPASIRPGLADPEVLVNVELWVGYQIRNEAADAGARGFCAFEGLALLRQLELLRRL